VLILPYWKTPRSYDIFFDCHGIWFANDSIYLSHYNLMLRTRSSAESIIRNILVFAHYLRKRSSTSSTHKKKEKKELLEQNLLRNLDEGKTTRITWIHYINGKYEGCWESGAVGNLVRIYFVSLLADTTPLYINRRWSIVGGAALGPLGFVNFGLRILALFDDSISEDL
jgi:hypothetical protein